MAPRGRPKTPATDPQKAVHGTDQPKTPPDMPKAPEIAEIRSMRYHAELPPRIFQAGETVPPGWDKTNGYGWQNNPDGSWRKGE